MVATIVKDNLLINGFDILYYFLLRLLICEFEILGFLGFGAILLMTTPTILSQNIIVLALIKKRTFFVHFFGEFERRDSLHINHTPIF